MIAIKSSNLQLHWGYGTRINKITVYSNDLWTIHCWKPIKRPILENISMYWKSLRKHQKYYHRINSVETTDFIMHIIVLCHNTCLWDFFTSKPNFMYWCLKQKKRPKVIWSKKKNVPVTNLHRNHCIWIVRFIEGSHASCVERQ